MAFPTRRASFTFNINMKKAIRFKKDTFAYVYFCFAPPFKKFLYQ